MFSLGPLCPATLTGIPISPPKIAAFNFQSLLSIKGVIFVIFIFSHNKYGTQQKCYHLDFYARSGSNLSVSLSVNILLESPLYLVSCDCTRNVNFGHKVGSGYENFCLLFSNSSNYSVHKNNFSLLFSNSSNYSVHKTTFLHPLYPEL